MKKNLNLKIIIKVLLGFIGKNLEKYFEFYFVNEKIFF